MSRQERPAPAVSIVMPVYNQERFVEATARSVLGQTFTDLELIAVDDGSRDGSYARLAAIDDPRLTAITQRNGGVSAARNAGIARARGRYVGFIDGDDLWLPEKVERHVRLLDAGPEIDLTFSRSRLVDENDRDMGRPGKLPPADVRFEDLFIENLTHNGSSVIVRRSAIDAAGGFDPELATLADQEQWLRIALLRPHNVAFIPDELTLYRVHSGQMTGNREQLVREWRMVRDRSYARAPERVARVERLAEASLLRHLGYISYEAGDHALAARQLAAALRCAPLHVVTDRRAIVLAAALAARGALPAALHRRLDRWARARRKAADAQAAATAPASTALAH
ncbi:MAG: glycosyltransferase [Candidatus Binatia bacterium]